MINRTIIFSFLGILFGCQNQDPNNLSDGQDGDHQDVIEVEIEDDEVELTVIQAEKIGLELSPVVQKNLKSTIKLNGQVELPPQSMAKVSSLVAGKINNIFVEPEQFVQKGYKLATLTHPSIIEWQQNYLEVQATLSYLEKELKRQVFVVENEIGPQKNLNKIESDLKVAKAQLVGLAAKFKLLGIDLPQVDQPLQTEIPIRSPIVGSIHEIHINLDVFVNPEKALFSIVNNQHLHIELAVFEKDLPYLKEGQEIHYFPINQPNQQYKARIFATGKLLNETSRTISVHAEIDNVPPTILPGMYVEAGVERGNETVPALPNEAIAMDNGLAYVFAEKGRDESEIEFKKIQVLTGASEFGFTEVNLLETVDDHANFVTKGAYFLMAQTKKGDEGAGHHH